MRSLIAFAVIVVIVSQCTAFRIRRGIITEHHGGGGGLGGGYEHGHATSYQNVHIETHHPVPVYIKHAPSKHPIGSVYHNVHVTHGHGKHDLGHASVSGGVDGGHHEGLSHYGGHEGLGAYSGGHGLESEGANELEGHGHDLGGHELGGEGSQLSEGHGYGDETGHYAVGGQEEVGGDEHGGYDYGASEQHAHLQGGH